MQAQRCGRCGAELLTGLCAGIDVQVDAAPLSPIGELHAVLAGVRTCTLHVVAMELHPRGAQAIRERPAGTRPRQSVHSHHRCGATWLALDTPAPDAPAADDAPPPY